MASVYDRENFAGRVNLAAQVITRGGRTSRAFDTCFEMFDGDAVAAALVRRAEKNEALRRNLFRYIGEGSATEAHKQLAGHNLAHEAKRMRDEAVKRHGLGEA